MVLLEDVTWPKPLDELLTGALESYRRGHPWVADARLSPKSVVRDMSERAMTFVEYVGALPAGPLRGPGAALPRRHLPGAAPDRARRGQDRGAGRRRRVARRAGAPGRLEPARRVGEARRRARTPSRTAGRRSTGGPRASPATSAPSACWCATRCSAAWSWPRCAGGTCWASWTARRAGTRSAGARRSSRTSPSTPTSAPARTPAARSSSPIDEEPQRWLVRQVLDDPAGDRDWAISAEVDLAASDEEGAAVVWVTAVEPLGGL